MTRPVGRVISMFGLMITAMAQRVQTFIEDDIDGGPAEETVSFGLDGRGYEIDLSAKNATKLRKAFSAYINGGRRTGRVSTARRSTAFSAASNDAGAIRAWAAENGYEISTRGRIPSQIQEAYLAAQ